MTSRQQVVAVREQHCIAVLKRKRRGAPTTPQSGSAAVSPQSFLFCCPPAIGGDLEVASATPRPPSTSLTGCVCVCGHVEGGDVVESRVTLYSQPQP